MQYLIISTADVIAQICHGETWTEAYLSWAYKSTDDFSQELELGEVTVREVVSCGAQPAQIIVRDEDVSGDGDNVIIIQLPITLTEEE